MLNSKTKMELKNLIGLIDSLIVARKTPYLKVLPFHLAPTSCSLVFFPYTFLSSISKKNSSIFPHAEFSSICKYISKFGLMRNRWQKVLPFHLAPTSCSLVFFPYTFFSSISKTNSSIFPHAKFSSIYIYIYIYFKIWPYAKPMTEGSSFSPRIDLIFSSIFPLYIFFLNFKKKKQ